MGINDLDFNTFSEEQLINYCKNIYIEKGIEALGYVSLSKFNNLYNALYSYGITQKKLLEILGLTDEYSEHRKNSSKWSYDKIKMHGSNIIKEYGYLPPAEWLRRNGYGSLVTGLYDLNMTFADLREVLNANVSSSFVLSKNGMRWRSHPEASFSNFLYTRGIEHNLGKKYPEDYASYSGRAYGYYDTQFLDMHGESIDVEIWGDKPNGSSEEFYAHKRGMKESYNVANTNFLGVEFRNCFEEERLTNILEPYIGVIEPYIFERSTDRIIPSTHWSNADELIDYCKDFIKQFSNEEFPTEEWLRKRGKFKDRDGVAYNTLAVYIKKWLGGVRKLRIILEQGDVSTEAWTREKVLDEYKKWYEKYNIVVGAARARYRRGQIQLTKEEYNKACCIEMAILKYVGSAVEAQKILGIEVKRPRIKKST
jgi:hypothetical protein